MLGALDEIERTASGITSDQQVPVPWSVMDRYLGAFLYDVSIARMFATREPANLVPSARLVNSCLACHTSL